MYISNLVDQLIDQEENHQAAQAVSSPVTTTSNPTSSQNTQLSSEAHAMVG